MNVNNGQFHSKLNQYKFNNVKTKASFIFVLITSYTNIIFYTFILFSALEHHLVAHLLQLEGFILLESFHKIRIIKKLDVYMKL